MSNPVIQTSFNSGEWSPALNARVDLTKYHSGAALLRNFFVDYRGGATARAGTRYIATSQNNGASPPRLIPFQASFTVSYILEFGVLNGSGYLAFYNNGAQVLSGGVPYTIPSPYASNELPLIKYTQNVSQMVLCHPNHPPYLLTLISATNWTLAAIIFGSTIAAPSAPSASSTLSAGSVNYAYQVTSVDANGQESAPSSFAILASLLDIRSTAGTNTVTWFAVTGAVSYNVYKATPRYGSGVPAGSIFGFVGNVTGTTFYDSNVTPDFSEVPPVPQDPFAGTGVQSITLTANGGSYTIVPSVGLTASPGGINAQAAATLRVTSVAVASGGSHYSIGDVLTVNGTSVVVQVVSLTGVGVITGITPLSFGSSVFGGAVPTTGVGTTNISGVGAACTVNLNWEVDSVYITNPGTEYITAPTVAFTGGGGGSGAAATTTLGAASGGNPTVPGFHQQRLVFAGPVNSPQQFNMSQPGAYFNFDTTEPVQPDNGITATLVSGQLNTIKSMISQPQGLIFLSDKQAWLVNSGSPGSGIDATALVANSQAYNGASDVPPIVANDNILYVQSKNSIVRDLVFNYYTQVYTGTDISVLSSHLFYGFQILQWAWAEEPFKIVWAVRNDGTLLSLTFLKEQELIAWAHSDTQGLFQSVATVTEQVSFGSVDAIYVVVQRTINGATVQYIERMAELYYPTGVTDAWCVDAGLQYNGTATLSFTGATQLAAATVTGLATDNLGNVTVITPFAMATNGAFTLPAPTPVGATGYTRVTIGLSYLPQLQTLALDLGEPTVQGKRKKIAGLTARCNQTLGLSAGRSFATLVPMQDLIVGNVGTMTNAVVTGLVTGDARIIIDPLWDVPGQYCLQQSFPYPASILGVIPEIQVGDSK